MSFKSTLAKAVAIGAVLATASTGIATAAVSSHGSPVYRSPSSNSRVVNFLTRGEHVRLIARQGSWCEVSIPGPDGWVRCSVLGNYPMNQFRPGITFNFGFGFPGMDQHHTGWWWNNNSHSWWNNNNDSHHNDQHQHP